MTKTLVIRSIYGIILPAYIGIIVGHCKDHYKPISIMECHKGLERCSNGIVLVPNELVDERVCMS